MHGHSVNMGSSLGMTGNESISTDVMRLAVCIRARNAAEWARLLLELRGRLSAEEYRRVRQKGYAMSLQEVGK